MKPLKRNLKTKKNREFWNFVDKAAKITKNCTKKVKVKKYIHIDDNDNHEIWIAKCNPFLKQTVSKDYFEVTCPNCLDEMIDLLTIKRTGRKAKRS